MKINYLNRIIYYIYSYRTIWLSMTGNINTISPKETNDVKEFICKYCSKSFSKSFAYLY